MNNVYFIFKFELPFFYCSIIIFIGILTNFYLQFKFNKNQLNNFTSTFFLFYDLIQLSILLYLTGGVTNPFTILLIVPAIVSSTFLTLRSTINLSVITIIILIVLTINHLPLPHSGELHFHVPDIYLYAVPIAIIIGLTFLTYFGVRFGIESRKRTEALNKLELILAKEHELESIGLQAAAAAHSLGTPLSTITVIARELEKEIGNNPKYSKDVDLLLSQTKRCSDILKNLSKDQLKEDNFLSNIKKHRNKPESEFERNCHAVLEAIRDCGENGMTRKQLGQVKRFKSLGARERSEITKVLVDDDLIRAVEGKASKNGGPKPVTYYAIKSDT